ncbi:MAG TPA: hypothetical protein VFJ14_09390 [Nocardioidaceae bacterium]|nr:hypothetical protein [Nocardioidaceae bacterium]
MRVIKALALLPAAALPLLAAGPAYAEAGDSHTFTADLGTLNDSGTTGTATVTSSGDQITVQLDVSGAVAGLPHAQHVHIGGAGVCPTMADDQNGDGILSTVEGQPSYGAIQVSLTTEGDTSPSSGLAVERMPTADDSGSYTYSRTIDVSSEVMANIEDGAASIVVHGIDSINPSGKYDGEPKSELDPALPLEATAPAACGELTAAPAGGVDTGAGSTEGPEALGLFALGGVALAGAAGVGIYRRRLVGRDS